MTGTCGLRALAAAMLICAWAAVPAASAGEVQADFAGRWRVAGVAVSDVGVQALTDDDPSLMGRRLTFTPGRLAWDRPPATGDVCIGPSFEPLAATPPDLGPELRKLGLRRPVAYAVHCRSGHWGPGDGATVYRGAAGALALPWYDGGVLKLVRR